MSERVCVIHAGTHKTGTTTLQRFLEMNAEPFHSAGLAFSKTGWYGVVPGNHSIAWDVLRGDFQQSVAGLMREFEEISSESVVLSAEDFSLLHMEPAHLARFVEFVRSAGFLPKILIYIRDQSGFAESMYAERVKHGFVQPFEAYVDGIVQNGFHDALGVKIEYRYDKLLDAFAAAIGRENVLVRPYIRSAPDGTIVRDFLAALGKLTPGFRVGGLELLLHPERFNESLTFGALLGNVFVRLRPDEPVPQDANAFFDAWVPGVSTDVLNGRFRLLEASDVERFNAAFADSNDRVAERFGVTVPASDASHFETIADVQRELLARCIRDWRR